MPTPGPKKFTVTEICKRWKKLYDEPFTSNMIVRMGREGQLEIESVHSSIFPANSTAELLHGRTTYFMTRKERDRFETENPPDHQNEPVKLAGKSKDAYLRLIGYMAERLADTDSLAIDQPFTAAQQIREFAELAGKSAGSKTFIGDTLAAASLAWEDSTLI